MALATTVARLLKIYGSDTISAADIQDFASEHAAQLREKALTRGLARKLLVLVRKEAGSALHADVFPALLGIISTLTENVASFRAFIDEALGKALVDVLQAVMNCFAVPTQLRADLCIQVLLWTTEMNEHSKADKDLNSSFVQALVTSGYLAAILEVVGQQGCDMDVRREASAAVTDLLVGNGAGLVAALLAHAATVHHLKQLAHNILRVPDYGVQANLAELLIRVLNSKAAKKSPDAAVQAAVAEIAAAVQPPALGARIQAVQHATDLAAVTRKLLNDFNATGGVVNSFPTSRLCWQDTKSETVISEGEWADVTVHGISLSIPGTNTGACLPLKLLTSVIFVDRAKSATAKLGPECPSATAAYLATSGFVLGEPSHALRLCFPTPVAYEGFRAALAAAQAQAGTAPDATVTKRASPQASGAESAPPRPTTAPPRPTTAPSPPADAKAGVACPPPPPQRASRVVSAMIPSDGAAADAHLPLRDLEASAVCSPHHTKAAGSTRAPSHASLPAVVATPAPSPRPETPTPALTAMRGQPPGGPTPSKAPKHVVDEFAFDLENTAPLEEAPAPVRGKAAAPAPAPAPAPTTATPSAAPKGRGAQAAPASTPAPTLPVITPNRPPRTPAAAPPPEPTPKRAASRKLPGPDTPSDTEKESDDEDGEFVPARKGAGKSAPAHAQRAKAAKPAATPPRRAAPPQQRAPRTKAPVVAPSPSASPVMTRKAPPAPSPTRGAKSNAHSKARNRSPSPSPSPVRRERDASPADVSPGLPPQTPPRVRGRTAPVPAPAPVAAPAPKHASKKAVRERVASEEPASTPHPDSGEDAWANAHKRRRPAEHESPSNKGAGGEGKKRAPASRPAEDGDNESKGMMVDLVTEVMRAAATAEDGQDDMQMVTHVLSSLQRMQQKKMTNAMKKAEADAAERIKAMTAQCTEAALEEITTAEKAKKRRLDTVRKDIDKQAKHWEALVAEQEKALATNKTALKQLATQLRQADELVAKNAEQWRGLRSRLRHDMDAYTAQCVEKLKAAAAPSGKPKGLGIANALQQMLQASLGTL